MTRQGLAVTSLASWLAVACCASAVAGVYENGLAAKQAGRVEEATSLLGKAVAAQPRNAEAWFNYGTVLGWQGKNDEALAAIRKGLAIAPKDYDLRVAEARVMAWKSDYAAADQRLDELDAEFPKNEEVLVMRGRVATWRGDPKEARRYYEEVLSVNPRQVDALTGLGDLEYDRSKFKQARELYARALEVDPSPDIQKRIDRIDNQTKWRADFGVTGSTFERGERDNWWSTFFAISTKIESWGIWARWEYGERFEVRDNLFEFGAAGPLVSGVQASVFGGFSPEGNYSANAYVEGALRWRLYKQLGAVGSGTLLTESRWADYEAAQVDTYRLGWEQAIKNGWTVSASWIRLHYDTGEDTDGWLAFIMWEPKERWMIRLGGGQSVESLTNQTIQQDQSLESWTVFLGMVMPVSENWHVRIDAEREDVKDSVVRYGMALSMGCLF
ncbi:YaiO family outer membrane protein [Roseimicrobium gellanilyticum]|uniref:YaiO family outer membrane protein n=1 Tax=Roseimicrobium gellanilyticum TaxID=748857 RepID=A0A366HBP6_9BACT|nr:tetratricopeptide repeat protein [Roseimicrobium gellanilyticum]RBP39781.1 YaiO family outer membrane protein [Roseimicrobium gellanilyticum]